MTLDPNQKQDGQIIILALIFVLIITALVASLVGYTMIQLKAHRQAVAREQGVDIAEAGVEAGLWKLNNQVGYSGETDTSYGNGTYSVSITDLGAGSKLITADAYIPNSSAPVAHRTVQVTITTGTTNVSFNYGAQMGEGGLVMDNNSTINGNVYSNGDIIGASGTRITGTAVSANGAALTADQTNNSPTPPPNSIIFRNASASADAAQSFQVSTDGPVNKVELYLRKVGAPSNFTAIRITNDNSGNPGATTIASGSLNASTITTNYGWVTASFSTNPQLTSGTTYWLVLDAASTSSSNYYDWGANTSYSNGQAKTGVYSGGPWSATGTDGYFNLYLGGLTHTIDSMIVGANAKAHSVTNSTITGTNYCQTGSGNNKACDTSQPDPTSVALPLSAGNITDFENEAANGNSMGSQTINGTTTTIGPAKINGDLTVTNGGVLTLNGTVWVTGNINVSNNATIRLAAGYGSASGVILAGVSGSSAVGNINLSNNVILLGSGTTGSYLMMLSEKDDPVNTAITLSNNASSVILYAGTGVIDVSNNGGAKEITGYKIHLNNNASITYDSGLASALFSSGPGGGWELTRQSWQLLQ